MSLDVTGNAGLLSNHVFQVIFFLVRGLCECLSRFLAVSKDA